MTFDNWLWCVKALVDNDPFDGKKAKEWYDANKTPLEFAIHIALNMEQA
jgi:hypothetical protein